MNDEDKRANRRVPVALRIRLRYQQVDQFISKFAVNVSRGGMFLSSRNPKPIGTRLQFEMRLADDSPVIEGSGEVRWIREYDRDRPNEPYGMGIQFTQLSPESRVLIERIIEHRRSLGGITDDDAIPMSPFVGPDGERATASASMVIPVQLAAKRPETIPVVEAPEEAAPEPMLPPPKRKTIPPPIPSAPATPPVVAPPPDRRRSARTTSDLVGYLGSEPPAVRVAMERARRLAGKLAGSEIDRELALLLADAPEDATPEVTIDAASRELAERLGGTAIVARDRSQRQPQPQPDPAPEPGDEHTGTAMPIEADDILDEAADDAQAGARR
ncbi:MAG TPA: TIGR02266 family protein [Kofleriaceae bacterium]|nr:TIGR02266 family protein [Kofleriaceae bacterium]